MKLHPSLCVFLIFLTNMLVLSDYRRGSKIAVGSEVFLQIFILFL